ncbi:response regulator receiver domain-containing protein [Sinobacterium caligoides]|uniref:Response regulator receiver domain-containing protein n=1 Tax=Sinobacterium caligoides TaxID=933926 RepID=A0A3N2DY90_9GAMM|nr:SpoIIE family protein phosphatase [Sinobacterium caligoides]ROS04811.1 response regulator receiver domain-containing protein [Sinobacterium caligoides]
MPTDENAVILTIDDDDGVRQSIAAYLEDSGFSVIEAVDGEQGLTLFEQYSPDIVLTDLRMPNIDGLTVLQEITKRVPEQPVIVISGAGGMNDAVEALRLGACDYFIKPIVDLEVLEHSIARCLEQSRLREENLRYRTELEAKNTQLKFNLKLLEQDQQAGRMIQQKLLPASPLSAGDYSLSHRIIPSLYLSGDFVDYLIVDGRWLTFFIADVSGHGASSAFLTALLKNFSARQYSYYQRGRSQAILEPKTFLGKVNRSLLNSGFEKHMTMFFGVIDMTSNEMSYSVAGHLPLPILVADGKPEYIQGKGMPVGLFEEADFHENTLQLPNTFTLNLFSDGILEILPPPDLMAKEAYLLNLFSGEPKDMAELSQLLALDTVEEAPDDIAVLMIVKG